MNRQQQLSVQRVSLIKDGKIEYLD